MSCIQCFEAVYNKGVLMRHCHFSILYNEIAFLKQKLPFLYQHFDQLIFFDLNITTNEFSNDGSHEFIKEFPDPEKKITLIEQQDLSSVTEFGGASFIEKRKMFAVGSKHVRDDIDFFWCTDMDEFFNATLIKAVEENIGDGQTALVPHIVFWKNEKWIGAKNGNTLIPIPWPRIAKHVPGHIYGHCNLQIQFEVKVIEKEAIYHFAFVSSKRMRFKQQLYKRGDDNGFFESINDDDDIVKLVFGSKYYDSLVKNKHPIPEYINVQEMLHDLDAEHPLY